MLHLAPVPVARQPREERGGEGKGVLHLAFSGSQRGQSDLQQAGMPPPFFLGTLGSGAEKTWLSKKAVSSLATHLAFQPLSVCWEQAGAGTSLGPDESDHAPGLAATLKLAAADLL